ncbi:uncharacterized protein LOC134272689 [Saccostrea cucullata]|uniref:uncharacterized protein LOC134272689 n=1 Tax=Saccostrea cuccullata TaxID=36930 RepID=UPI002ED26794
MLSGLDNKLNDVNTKMNDLDNKLDKLKCYNSSGFCYISAQLSPITKSLTGKTENEREGSTYQKKEGPGGSGESKKIKQMDPCYVLVKDLEKTEEKNPQETKRKLPLMMEKAQKKKKSGEKKPQETKRKLPLMSDKGQKKKKM